MKRWSSRKWRLATLEHITQLPRRQGEDLERRVDHPLFPGGDELHPGEQPLALVSAVQPLLPKKRCPVLHQQQVRLTDTTSLSLQPTGL